MYSNRFHSFTDTSRVGRIAAAAVLALALSPAGLASAASTSPGKTSAFESSSGVMTTFSPKPAAIIAKGKRKTVLAIEASYSDGASYPTAPGIRVLGMIVTVNGIQAQPNPFSAYQYLTDCGFYDTPTIACSVTGTFWFDIDAAELANPGMFVGQPLNVVLTAGDLTAGALVGVIPMDTSLTVRVTKK
jgi:hypothetical protein